jgi:hypothetical protein
MRSAFNARSGLIPERSWRLPKPSAPQPQAFLRSQARLIFDAPPLASDGIRSFGCEKIRELPKRKNPD